MGIANKYDVLILGAGAAGLMAAKSLNDAGLEVYVVEARDRVGGRIWTVADPRADVPIELGAEFLHGHAPEVFNLIRGYGLPFYEVDGDYWCAYDGELKACDFWDKIEAVLKKMNADGPDSSFLEFLNRQSLDPKTRRQV